MLKGNKHHHRSAYDLRADFENIKDAVIEATDDVKGRIGEIVFQSIRDAKDKSDDVKDNIAHYVAKKPFKSIGIALLSGFIFGYFFRK